jgi:hypothetical protein
MVNDLLARLDSVVDQMTTAQWVIAGTLALVLAVAVVRKLAKTALLVAVLFAVGMILVHGRAENWSF